MTKLLASLAIAGSLLAGIASANAQPTYGNALSQSAHMGQITPHGVFDAQ